MLCYSESTAFGTFENCINNLNIILALRFQLRENIQDALARTFAMFGVFDKSLLHQGTCALQVTQFIHLARF